MEKDTNIAEIKKVLQEANLYEPNMSENEMVQCYEAINDSKNTASEQNDTRDLNESQKNLLNLLELDDDNSNPLPTTIKSKSFTPKNWSSGKKNDNEDVSERNNNENKEKSVSPELTNDCPKDATKEMFGFNEMMKDSNKSLTITVHRIKFIPIQNSSKFLKADLNQKAKMLYAYHTKLDKMKSRLAKMSFYPAPIPKLTSTADTFPSTSDDIDFEETYISRSGRQTKRKVYNYDDEDSLDNTSSKKTKNSEEGEWLSKSSPNKNQRSKKTESNHITSKVDAEVEITVTNSSNGTSSNETPSKPPPKIESKPSNVLKKLTNFEIMKRSRIFSDAPKRRCELMFEKLKDAEDKKQREEKTMEAFNKTLEGLDEEDNDFEDTNVEINVSTDSASVRKRVVPPLPRRRPINRKRCINPLNVVVSSPGSSKDTPKKQDEESPPKVNGRKRLNRRKSATEKEDDEEVLPSTSQPPKESGSTNVTCPICNGSFRGDKIEEHASSCGDEPVTRSSTKFSRITCPICDMVIPPNVDFHSHIEECRSGKDDSA